MRVFLDTNVLVSAFATRGLCADLLRHLLGEHELIVGEVVISELTRVLRDRFRVPVRTIAAIESMLREHTVVLKPAKAHPLPERDPDDRWVLASAVAGNADVLVTGDADLLELGSKAAPLQIVSPRAFWQIMRDSGSQR